MTDRQHNAGNHQVHLAVSGASCASCVRSIEQALLSVEGVTSAHMNLADSVATAGGQADPDTLAKAVSSAGYSAHVLEDPDTAQDNKEQEDIAQYRTLAVKVAASLGLGIALMVWGRLWSCGPKAKPRKRSSACWTCGQRPPGSSAMARSWTCL